MSKIAKFGCEMLENTENIALQSLKILYTFVLRAEIPFRPKCGRNFRTQYKSIQNLQTLQGYIFRNLQHFATKLCNFTHFSMLFPGIYFFAKIKK
jgi:hypothetical protein